jgi:Uncharacterised nucleotidyltransferase
MQTRANAAVENFVRLQLLQRIGERFERQGIKLLALKGMALLGREYINIGGRQMHDIDLLVDADQFGAAAVILQEMGISPFEKDIDLPGPLQYYHRVYLADIANYKLVIELHTGFIGRAWFRIDYRQIIERAEPHPLPELADRGVYRPCPEHMLLHLAVHRLKEAYTPHQRDACDAFRILNQHRPDLELLENCARNWRMTATLAFFLEYLQRISEPLGASCNSRRRLSIASERLPQDDFRKAVMDKLFDFNRENNYWKLPLPGVDPKIMLLFLLLNEDPTRLALMPATAAVRRLYRKLKS